MHTTPYIQFHGQCQEALSFYEAHLGAKIDVIIPFSEMPDAEQAPIPEEWKSKAMHAEWQIGESQLMACDAPPGMYSAPQGFYLNLMVDSVEAAEKAFNILSEEGQIDMPFTETFFAHRFGMLKDKFSIPWMVAYLKDPEAQA